MRLCLENIIEDNLLSLIYLKMYGNEWIGEKEFIVGNI